MGKKKKPEDQEFLFDETEMSEVPPRLCYESNDKKFRFLLEEYWGSEDTCIVFMMLNPSKADLDRDDNTSSWCKAFAKKKGVGGVILVNLFPVRSTDPKLIPQTREGALGDKETQRLTFVYLNSALMAAKNSKMFNREVICAWGDHGDHLGRADEMLDFLIKNKIKPMALKRNASGHPAHPRGLSHDLVPFPLELPLHRP